MGLRQLALFALMMGSLLVACSCDKVRESADRQALTDQMGRYFATWSAGDMQGYAACFDPAATIHFVADDESAHLMHLDEFIRSQVVARAAARGEMREKATSWQIHVVGRIAQVSARWELSKPDGMMTGNDFYTFRKSGDAWKIVNLVFENDD